jgi:RHS repeat-associated protein
VIADYDYIYDLANQLIQETHHGNTTDYTYDLIGQLTGANHTLLPDEFYTYDANGNRTSSHLHSSGYVTGPNNQLQSDGEFNYDYDDEGNLILKTEIATGNITEYVYDHRNRVVRIEERSSGGIILSECEYVYDVEGRRIATILDIDGVGPAIAETTYYTYNGDNTWADFNGLSQVIARYLYDNDIDRILARWRAGSGTTWYLTDRLGSIHDLVDSAGVVINRINYDSFGRVLMQTNPGVSDRFLFTGREFDSNLGQYYFRARYYSPSIGRFIQVDPIGFEARDANLYRYVFNSPTFDSDPTGTSPRYAISLRTVFKISTGTAFVFGSYAICQDQKGIPRNNPHLDCLMVAWLTTIALTLGGVLTMK